MSSISLKLKIHSLLYSTETVGVLLFARGSDVRLGLGIVVGGNLITSLRLGIDLSLDIGMGVGMHVDSVVNILSSCCL